MGTIQHHAVVATSFSKASINQVLLWIESLNANDKKHFILGPKLVNGYQTIVLVPDGSKEGWQESNDGNSRREQFKLVLQDAGYFDWVEVTFGEQDYMIVSSDI